MSHDQRPAKVRMIDGGVLTPQAHSARAPELPAPSPAGQADGIGMILLYLFAAAAGGALTMALDLVRAIGL